MNLKQLAFILLLGLLIVYFLIFISRHLMSYSMKYNKICNHKKVQSKQQQSSCGSESCLDKYNYSDCECHKNQVKNELFTMAQSVFPLHAPTLPAFSQILNENMSNINASYTEQNKADPYTRKYPSKETTTGFFNIIHK
jgi:hypothetical protein